jgi:hypothetical protein
MIVDVTGRIFAIERGGCPRQLSEAQWQWIKPRLCNWLYARRNMQITEKQYYRHFRYLVAQCPRKAANAS